MDFSGFAAPQPGFRNLLINGNFAVNQRGYASGAALPSGAFGHDRWKNDGGPATTYTFTAGTPDTLIAITADNLRQTIEPLNVAGGAYTLSWIGTAQAYIFWAPPGAGAYTQVGPLQSPAVMPSIPAGSTVIVQFQLGGTLGLAQFEAGTTPTPFERRPASVELALCQRYCRVLGSAYLQPVGVGEWVSSTSARILVPWRGTTMRATPTVSFTSQTAFYVDGNGTSLATTSLSVFGADPDGMVLLAGVASGGTTGQAALMFGQTGGNLIIVSAEL